METLNNKKDYKEHEECLESEASFTSQSGSRLQESVLQRKHVMKKQTVYYVKVLQCH